MAKRAQPYRDTQTAEGLSTARTLGQVRTVAPRAIPARCKGIGGDWLAVAVVSADERTVTLRLPEPPSGNRYWRVFRGRMVLSAEGRAYKKAVQASGPDLCLAGPVAVTVEWFRGRRAGDLDNRVKIVLDALQGVAYANDGQVVRLLAVRAEDKHNPRVVVTVTRMEDAA